MQQGDFAAARAILEGVEECFRKHGASDQNLQTVTFNLSRCLMLSSEFEEASAALAESQVYAERLEPSGGPLQVSIAEQRCALALNLGEYEKAEAIGREGYELALEVHGPSHPLSAYLGAFYAQALAFQGKDDAARAISTDALEQLASAVSPSSDTFVDALRFRIVLLLEVDDTEAALEVADQMIANTEENSFRRRQADQLRQQALQAGGQAAEVSSEPADK